MDSVCMLQQGRLVGDMTIYNTHLINHSDPNQMASVTQLHFSPKLCFPGASSPAMSTSL
jgi:hypothetical protein